MDLDAKKASSPSKRVIAERRIVTSSIRSAYPRNLELLKELREVTATHPRVQMATAPDASQMIPMLLKLIGAKRMIEIGGLTRYYVLLTALSIPDDGKIIAVDMNRKAYDMGLPVVKKVRMKHKIDFMESKAFPVLDKLRKT